MVLDAAVVVEWLLQRPHAAEADVWISDPDLTLHAPAHLPVEAAAALRGLLLGGHVGEERAQQALFDLLDLDVALHDPSLLLPRAWELRASLSVYDACYVALAEALAAPLVTADRRLASAPGVEAVVVVVQDN